MFGARNLGRRLISLASMIEARERAATATSAAAE